MKFDQLIASITPEIYQRLKRAVELGKWDNGAVLTAEQRESCMQAVIAYDAKHQDESERVGYIEPKPHSACGSSDEEEWQTIKFDE